MNILITGGAGFLGSYLAEELIKEGYKVTVLDNFFRGKKENLAGILDKITLVEGDTTDRNILRELSNNFDIVYHLAGISQVMEAVQKPHLCFDYNIKGTHNIIDVCIKSGAKLVFASSREVYGEVGDAHAHEDSQLNPKNNYGISKMAGEAMIKSYGKNLDYVIFRIANAVGRRDFGRVVPIFLEKCRNNDPITLYGGKQVVDFVYVSDVVEAFKKAASARNEVFNIGSGKGTTVEDVALKIKKLTGSYSEIFHEMARKQETQNYVASISKARKLLGWEPKVGLEEALKRIIE